nr:integrase, catalytic region, zinc finger, CCHC-type, peptidase aspartic, catalytic [Tanacetum cinerariifolium]
MNMGQDRHMQMVRADFDEIEEVNANCILMGNLQQASTSGTQTDKAPVYDSDGSAEFLGTVRFENDHIAAILGFSDLQWGNILITRVYFVEGLGHNLFAVGQFCDSDLEVKENQEKDKIGSKPDKNGKRGEARKSQKQSQSIKQEKTEENTKRRAVNAKSYKLY